MIKGKFPCNQYLWTEISQLKPHSVIRSRCIVWYFWYIQYSATSHCWYQNQHRDFKHCRKQWWWLWSWCQKNSGLDTWIFFSKLILSGPFELVITTILSSRINVLLILVLATPIKTICETCKDFWVEISDLIIQLTYLEHSKNIIQLTYLEQTLQNFLCQLLYLIWSPMEISFFM